jgi:hypothetical protein
MAAIEGQAGGPLAAAAAASKAWSACVSRVRERVLQRNMPLSLSKVPDARTLGGELLTEKLGADAIDGI